MSEEENEKPSAADGGSASILKKVKRGDIDEKIKTGTPVMLKGLSIEYLNGRMGFVVDDSNVEMTGRFKIKLEGPYRSPSTGKGTDEHISIKRENVKVVGKSQACNGCKMTFGEQELRKCSRCRVVRYCSKECQRADWNAGHKEDCPILSNAKKSASHGEDAYPLPEDAGDRVFAIMQRGILNMQRENLAAAERDFRRLIEVEGFDSCGAYTNLGSVLMQQGKFRDAQRYLEIAITQETAEGPNELRVAYEMLGNSYLLHDVPGNKERGIAIYRRALQLFPGDPMFKATLDQLEKKK